MQRLISNAAYGVVSRAPSDSSASLRLQSEGYQLPRTGGETKTEDASNYTSVTVDPITVEIVSNGGGNDRLQPPPSNSDGGSCGGNYKRPEEKTDDMLGVPRHIMSSRAKSRKPIMANLAYYQTSTLPANTASSFSFALTPNADASYLEWRKVFDEMRVVSAEIFWHVWFSVLPTAFAAQPPNAIIVYEPTSTVQLSAVNEGLQYDGFSLCSVAANAGGTYAVAPQNVEPGGYMRFRAKMPSGTQLGNITTTNSTGMWRPTRDGATYDWGSFAGYAAQAGATSVLTVHGFVRMRVEFRIRS